VNDTDVVPGSTSPVIDKNVMVPMRASVRLATDVYRPHRQGQFPTLVERMLYNTEIGLIVNFTFDALRAEQAGFAVIVQDTRGRYGSEGTFSPLADEACDGADTIAWAAEQRWSNGRVGMVGASYLGATRWPASTQAPVALRALASGLTADCCHEGWTYQNGALQPGFINHWAFFVLGLEQVIRQVSGGMTSPDRIGEFVEQLDTNATFFEPLRCWICPRCRTSLRTTASAVASELRLLERYRTPGGVRADHGAGDEHRLVRPVPERHAGKLEHGRDYRRRARVGLSGGNEPRAPLTGPSDPAVAADCSASRGPPGTATLGTPNRDDCSAR